MKFITLSKDDEAKIYYQGIQKRIDFKGREIVENLHEKRWTEWNNYKYNEKLFLSGKEYRGGKCRYRLTLKWQSVRLLKNIIIACKWLIKGAKKYQLILAK